MTSVSIAYWNQSIDFNWLIDFNQLTVFSMLATLTKILHDNYGQIKIPSNVSETKFWSVQVIIGKK